MGPKTEQLIALLDQSVSALRDSGDDYHARKAEECSSLLRRSDFRGISRTLSVFSARGSLNDVPEPPLGDLGSKIWELAEAIRREVERETYRDA